MVSLCSTRPTKGKTIECRHSIIPIPNWSLFVCVSVLSQLFYVVKIIFHGGPTNSGKTYNALKRLKKAEKGLYLGPLRLLAAEVYETLMSDGVYTNLFTGQERREIAFSTHAAATVEMANTNEEYDVVVIDEIQMIQDTTRGAAWTKALLGLRCKEIHVCGGLEAKVIVQKIAKACGDDFEVRKYKRFAPLKVADRSLSNDPVEVGCYKKVSFLLVDLSVLGQQGQRFH